MRIKPVSRLPAGGLADLLLPVGLLGSLCLFVLWPMVCLRTRSFSDGAGGVTPAHYSQVWQLYDGSLSEDGTRSWGFNRNSCEIQSQRSSRTL